MADTPAVPSAPAAPAPAPAELSDEARFIEQGNSDSQTHGDADNPPIDPPQAPEPPVETKEGEGEGGEKEDGRKTPWFTRRISELTAERNQARDQAVQYETYLRQVAEAREIAAREGADTGSGQPAPLSPQQIDALTRQRAAEMLQAQEFNRACDSIYENGTKAFPDFEQALGNFKLMGGITADLIEAAQESGEPHRVLYELGKNPEELERVMKLSPVRRAAAVAKIAAKPAAPPPVTRAPPPITPVNNGGNRATDTLDDSLDINEWMRRHDALEARKRA